MDMRCRGWRYASVVRIANIWMERKAANGLDLMSVECGARERGDAVLEERQGTLCVCAQCLLRTVWVHDLDRGVRSHVGSQESARGATKCMENVGKFRGR